MILFNQNMLFLPYFVHCSSSSYFVIYPTAKEWCLCVCVCVCVRVHVCEREREIVRKAVNSFFYYKQIHVSICRMGSEISHFH